jgi:hypothetical protein
MNTECSAERINFHGLGGRGVVGRFDGGARTDHSRFCENLGVKFPRATHPYLKVGG